MHNAYQSPFNTKCAKRRVSAILLTNSEQSRFSSLYCHLYARFVEYAGLALSQYTCRTAEQALLEVLFSHLTLNFCYFFGVRWLVHLMPKKQ